MWLKAKQRWYEWRGSIATAARKAVEERLEQWDTTEARVLDVEFLLDADTIPFIWKSAEPHMDPSVSNPIDVSKLADFSQ